jgi:hypothetical protein
VDVEDAVLHITDRSQHLVRRALKLFLGMVSRTLPWGRVAPPQVHHIVPFIYLEHLIVRILDVGRILDCIDNFLVIVVTSR